MTRVWNFGVRNRFSHGCLHIQQPIKTVVEKQSGQFQIETNRSPNSNPQKTERSAARFAAAENLSATVGYDHSQALTDAIACLNQLKCEEGLQILSEALQIDPTNPKAYLNMGMFLIQIKQFKDALRVFDDGLMLNPDAGMRINFYAYKAEAFGQLGDLPNAKRLYDLVLEKNPNHIQANHGLAVLLIDWGAFQQAEKLLTHVLSGEDLHPAVYCERAFARAKLNNLKGAIEDCTAALELCPTFIPALASRSNLYQMIGRDDLADIDLAKLHSFQNSAGILNLLKK
ncbi:MAG: tetratricopeptide repeat protein [Pseudomonadota bacterium]